jgi:streptogramin lyase
MAVEGRIEIGHELAGYRIEELLGRGGMGEVYRARHDRLERNVALKILAPRYAADDAFRERLVRESRIAASLDHPNVVPIYDAGEADGRLYLAMRYVEGTDLRSLLRREGALPPERALAVAAQIAAALDAAHEQGLVHRDVKPSNVLLDARGHCYLADFGLTQSASDTSAFDGQLLGTIDYVAPEQIRGDPVDGRADIYALGCLVYECLTGSVPFARPSEVATIFAHLDEPPEPASLRRPELPATVDEVLARALAKDRDERQPTCGRLIDETRAALGLETPHRSRAKLVALVAALLAVTVAATVAAAIALSGGAGGAPSSGGIVARIDPLAKEVTATYRLSAYPGSVAASGNRVWVGDFRDGSLWRLDPTSGDLERFTTTGEPRDVSTTGAKVYVSSDGETILDGTVTRYDAVTGQREAGVRLLTCSVAAGDGVVWVAGCPSIQRLSTDSGTFRVLREVELPWRQPRSAETERNAFRDMAVGEGALWVLSDPIDRRVFKIDRRSGAILAVTQLPFAPRSIAAGEGGVWITGPIDDVVARLDPRSGKVRGTLEVPAGASGIGVGLGGVWVASALDGTVSRIDPRSFEIAETIDVDGLPREVAVGAGGVWVTADGA